MRGCHRVLVRRAPETSHLLDCRRNGSGTFPNPSPGPVLISFFGSFKENVVETLLRVDVKMHLLFSAVSSARPRSLFPEGPSAPGTGWRLTARTSGWERRKGLWGFIATLVDAEGGPRARGSWEARVPSSTVGGGWGKGRGGDERPSGGGLRGTGVGPKKKGKRVWRFVLYRA